MATRFHTDLPLAPDAQLSLPPEAARHVQVLRLQPGASITLFDGRGGQWLAEVLSMGRKDVLVQVRSHQPVERELAAAVTLALGMPANERMDALIEKATELGVAAIQPLVCERSVLRLAGDRAERKAAHWQAVAAAACEQSGRNRVPLIHTPRTLRDWLPDALPAGQRGLLLSLAPDAPALPALLAADRPTPATTVLSGPEGGLSPAEQALAQARGFQPASLGPRVLRADTAPLAALACLGLLASA
jgi:16S rRNA (uracil1498-N3)-methyltransferase